MIFWNTYITMFTSLSLTEVKNLDDNEYFETIKCIENIRKITKGGE